jgi:MYXO-CTERM domain-containing protein
VADDPGATPIGPILMVFAAVAAAFAGVAWLVRRRGRRDPAP